MSIFANRAGLALLVALASLGLSNNPRGQERAGPLGTILAFVREDVPKLAPPRLAGADISSDVFLTVPRSPAYDILGPLNQRSLTSLGVTLMDDHSEVLLAADGGSHVRDNGVYVVIGPIHGTGDNSPHPREGALKIDVTYYVTLRRPGANPSIAFTSWRLVLKPSVDSEHGWEVVKADRLGIS